MRNTALYLLSVAVTFLGLSVISVPVYRIVCQAFAVGGTVQNDVEKKMKRIAMIQEDDALGDQQERRSIRVCLNAATGSMPWSFTPLQRFVDCKIGESTLVFFRAENHSNYDVTGIATYNVSPSRAGLYFNKIQCFCFEEQRLRAHEVVDMPVFFFVDPDYELDPTMDRENEIVLSYHLFEVEDEEGEFEPNDHVDQWPGTPGGVALPDAAKELENEPMGTAAHPRIAATHGPDGKRLALPMAAAAAGETAATAAASGSQPTA